MALRDENVEAVRAARELLLRKYRGLRGWFRHLQKLDAARSGRAAKGRRSRRNTDVAQAR